MQVSEQAVMENTRTVSLEGGKTNSENLRLVCRAHNQLAAIQQFGSEKMSPYIRLNRIRD